MTQSTGAEAPEETTATLTDEDVISLMEAQDPTVAETIQSFRTRGELDGTFADQRERGPVKHEAPYTEAEAQEMVTWWLSVPPAGEEDGPHGPGCQCGLLTADEKAAVDELMGLLAPALAEAMGVGRTPAEKRTNVSDPEAAILNLLGGLQPLVDNVIKAAGGIGVGASMMDRDPIRAMTAIGEETKKLRLSYKAIRDVVVQVSQFLPAIKGVQAVDRDGLPIWFLPGMEGDSGWLTTAQAESPGEDWKAVYVR